MSVIVIFWSLVYQQRKTITVIKSGQILAWFQPNVTALHSLYLSSKFAHHAKLFWRCRHLQQAGGATSGSPGPTTNHVDPVQAGYGCVHGPGLQHGRCRRAGEGHRTEAPHFVRCVVQRLGHVQAYGAAAVSTATACHKHLSEQLVSFVCQGAKDIQRCFSHLLSSLLRLGATVRHFSLLLCFSSDQCKTAKPVWLLWC